jgi:hypothetical protein
MAANTTELAQPPIRWPHFNRTSVLTFALWGIGLIVALLIPASIVSPGQTTATAGAAWAAFSFTVLGAAIMMITTWWRWRKTRDAGILILGIVPGSAVVVGGIILATAKVLGAG